jgi:acetyl esterase/lipase
VVSAGHSAGGNFALWLAARPRIAADSPLRIENPLAIGGVLALAPAGDFLEMHAQGACGGVMESLMGGSPSAVPDRYRAASPGQLLPIGKPQAIVIAARDASFAPLGRSYAKLAAAAGDKGVFVVDAPASGHFDVIAPITPTWNIVVQALRTVFSRIRP